VVGGTVFFLVLGRGVLFPISCELGFYPLLVRVGAKGGAFNLPRTPSTLFHSPGDSESENLLRKGVTQSILHRPVRGTCGPDGLRLIRSWVAPVVIKLIPQLTR
jgi:hypothetical protein